LLKYHSSTEARAGDHRVVHGLGQPAGWVGLDRNFPLFGGLVRVGSWVSLTGCKNKAFYLLSVWQVKYLLG